MQSYFPPGDYTSGSIRYRWVCSRCERITDEVRQFCRGDAIWIPPALPQGWNKVSEQIFCPDHKIRTFVDDKLVGTEAQVWASLNTESAIAPATRPTKTASQSQTQK